jgi:hypothetical protein
MCPLGHRLMRQPIGGNGMPRHSRTAFNADAETASLRENRLSRHLRVCPRKAFSPSLGHLAEGRAPHARIGRHWLDRGMCPLGHRLIVTHRVEMECLGIRGASQRGRTECVPPRKPPFAPSPGLPPEGLLPSLGPPRGGAGSARPQGRHGAKPNVASFWPRPPRQSVGEGDMPRLASGPYSRTRRPRPSEKTTPRVISGLSPASQPSWGDRAREGPLPLPITQTKRGIRRSPLFSSAPRPSRRCTSASRRAPRHRHHHLLQANWPELA